MVAGFLAMVDSGHDYETALNFASACGSATAASKALAKRETIDRLYLALGKVLDKHADEIAEALERAKQTRIEKISYRVILSLPYYSSGSTLIYLHKPKRKCVQAAGRLAVGPTAPEGTDPHDWR